MKISEYVTDTPTINKLYEDMDLLNMLDAIQKASEPWKIKSTITNNGVCPRINVILNILNRNQVEAIQRIQQNTNRLFKSIFKKYFTEKFGLEKSVEVYIAYNEDFLELSVLTSKIIIKYSSTIDMINKVLNYETDKLFNNKIFNFIRTLYNMSDSNSVWTEINRNGTAILHTNDGLSIKIKQSFHNELKYLAAQSTGVRKENVAKALAILEKA